MNMYDIILFFEVDLNCAYAEFDVFCVYVKYKWNNFYKCIFGKNYFLNFFFLFSKASEYCSERQKLHSNFLTSRGSGHVRFAEKPGWGIHAYAYLVFI